MDNSAVPELAGWGTWDLQVTTDTDWLSAQMVLTVDNPGDIYQDSLGNVSPLSPNPAFFPIQPSLEFDTYVSNGQLGLPVSVLAAVDFGEPVVTFDENKLALLWFTDALTDVGTLSLARITLNGEATGTWRIKVTAAPQGGPVADVQGTIVGGELIPEPATLAMLSLGGLIAARRRRRR